MIIIGFIEVYGDQWLLILEELYWAKVLVDFIYLLCCGIPHKYQNYRSDLHK